MDLAQILYRLASQSWPLVGTLLTGFLIYEKKEYDKTQNVRRAFIAELDSTDLPTRIELDDGNTVRPPYNAELVPTTVYDTNSANMGKMTKEEVKLLTEYYSKAKDLDYLSAVMFELGRESGAQFEHLEDRKSDAKEVVEDRLDHGFVSYLLGKVI